MTYLFQIHSLTGAVVSARGRYKALGDCSNNDPLHLHVSADSEDKVKAAVERINKIMGPNPLKVKVIRASVVNLLYMSSNWLAGSYGQ